MNTILVGAALLLGGAALVWVAWSGSQGRLSPNGVIGLRVRATRRSDAAWYAAHRSAAGSLGVTGGVTAACGLAVLFTGLDVVGAALSLGAAVVLVVGTAWSMIVGIRAARAEAG